MYDSVTVAAFGGVVLQLPGGVDRSVPFRGFGASVGWEPSGLAL